MGCPNNMKGINDIIKKQNEQNEQKQSIITEQSLPLIKDENINNLNINKNEYKFVIEPHLNKELNIHHYDIMLFYPFIIILLFIVMIFLFCRPIQKLFLCDKVIQKIIKNKYISKRKGTATKQQLQHFHI